MGALLSWILNSVSKETFGGIIYSTDAETVWKDLKERFDKVNRSRIFALQRILVDLHRIRARNIEKVGAGVFTPEQYAVILKL